MTSLIYLNDPLQECIQASKITLLLVSKYTCIRILRSVTNLVHEFSNNQQEIDVTIKRIDVRQVFRCLTTTYVFKEEEEKSRFLQSKGMRYIFH